MFVIWLKQLRSHQWVKNLLIFVPLLASHSWEGWRIESSVLAFVAFSACASCVYLLNDLVDLERDRLHPVKRRRPLASGALPRGKVLMAIPILLMLAAGISLAFLPLGFGMVLLAYFGTTVLYSTMLKKLPVVDVLTLAVLYSVRIIAGTHAIQVVASFWIIAFSLFIFTSLAFAKRYTDLRDALEGEGGQVSPDGKIDGRGYHGEDAAMLLPAGVSSGMVSVLVAALYIQDEHTQVLYRHHVALWLVCPILIYWISWLWLCAYRGNLHADPIVFALKDKASLICGGLMLAAFIIASF